MADNEDDLRVRGEDFRRAWSHALARALREASDLTDELNGLTEKVIELAQLTPKMLQVAEQRLAKATERCVDSITKAAADAETQTDAARQELIQAHMTFIDTFAKERTSIERARAAADVQRLDIVKAQDALDEAKRKFNKMGLLSRIFARV